MNDERKVTTEKRGHLLLIGLHRPNKLNAFDADMLQQFSRAYLEMERDDDVRCGVVFAHGEHFTAGLDLADVAPRILAGELTLGEGDVDPWGVHGPARTKPVVIAVHGRCLTMGIELCLAQDVVIAARSTQFAQIEIKRGIFPFGGGTYRLVHTAGWGNAMRWLLTGDTFDAVEAHRIGLVQEIVDDGAQLERAIAIATTIALQAPMGVRETIASARRSLTEDSAAKALIPNLQRLMASADAQEGMLSFLERRPATFHGK